MYGLHSQVGEQPGDKRPVEHPVSGLSLSSSDFLKILGPESRLLSFRRHSHQHFNLFPLSAGEKKMRSPDGESDEPDKPFGKSPPFHRRSRLPESEVDRSSLHAFFECSDSSFTCSFLRNNKVERKSELLGASERAVLYIPHMLSSCLPLSTVHALHLAFNVKSQRSINSLRHGKLARSGS